MATEKTQMSDTIEIVVQETTHLEITGVGSAAAAIREADKYMLGRRGQWALYGLQMISIGVWCVEMAAVGSAPSQ